MANWLSGFLAGVLVVALFPAIGEDNCAQPGSKECRRGYGTTTEI